MARFLAKCETVVMLSLTSTETRGMNSSLGSRPREQTVILRRRPPRFFHMANTSNASGFKVILIPRLGNLNWGGIVQI